MTDYENVKSDPQEELLFKPLTEGLGFQPFSDGLPYAPLGKSHRGVLGTTQGAGATVAGPHRFSPPKNQKGLGEGQKIDPLQHEQAQMHPSAKASPSLLPVQGTSRSYPSMSPASTPRLESPSQVSRPSSLLSSSSVSSSVQSQNSSAREESGGETLPSDYLMKRVLAYGLDLVFNSILMSMILLTTFWFYEVDMQILLHSSLFGVVIVLLVFMNWTLVLLQEVVFKTSLGKLFFRLALAGSRIQILVRGLFFPLSCGLGGAGLIWAWFNPNKACFHDQLLGSQPLEMNNYD